MNLKKTILIIVTIFLTIIGILFFNLAKPNITGNVIEGSHLSTMAICNETNFCQDYEIICHDNQVLNISPISGAVVQHSLEWEDPRGKIDIEKLCK